MIIENLVLISCSLVLLSTIAAMVYRQRHCLSLVEIYAMMTGLYFGVWGILDAAVQKFTDYNILAIILVYTIVTITLSISWYILRVYLPKRNWMPFLGLLELSSIARVVGRIPKRYIALFVFSLLIFKFYSIGKYNIVNNYDWDSLAEYHIVLPSWFIIADGMLRSLLFIAIIPTAVGCFRDQGWSKLVWILIATMILFIEMMYGRSSVFNFIIMFFACWYVACNKNDLFRVAYQFTTGVILTVILLFLYSNFYQTYRSIFILKYGYTNGSSFVADKLIPALRGDSVSNNTSSTSPSVSHNVNNNVLKNVLNSNKTIDNFKVRPAIWRFNYRFIDKQLNGEYHSIPYGVLLKDAVIFMIPRVIWHDKPNFLVQPEAYKLYHFIYKYSDAPSIFAFVQIDFGFLSLFIIPLFLLLGFIPTAYALFLSSNRPILFAIIVGEFGYYCVDIPRDYYGLFMYYRELIFILIFYAAFCGIRALFWQRKLIPNRVSV